MIVSLVRLTTQTIFGSFLICYVFLHSSSVDYIFLIITSTTSWSTSSPCIVVSSSFENHMLVLSISRTDNQWGCSKTAAFQWSTLGRKSLKKYVGQALQSHGVRICRFYPWISSARCSFWCDEGPRVMGRQLLYAIQGGTSAGIPDRVLVRMKVKAIN